ncbi:14633_t:CDS:10 [Rhizophagus irregularis]|nr:14633_t:CDS:10 [Rhizophagus irregularis]
MSLPYDSRQSRFTSFDNFQKFISTKKVLCKCGKTVSLGAIYQVANFQRHFQSKNCDYYLNKQPSINVFFSNSISENDEENRNDEGSNDERNRKRIAVRCQGLCDLEHINYVINSPASFGGGKRARSYRKTTFSRKVSRKNPFTRKKLNKKQLKEFERVLEAEATWQLKGNKRLDEALKALLELLKISNLRQFLAATNSKSDNAEFWIKVAQFGLSGTFSGDKTFAEKKMQTDSIVVTNPDLSWHILRNYEKLERPNHIAGSTLPHSETTIARNDAIATQVRDIASKIPIGKVAPMIVAMIPTKVLELMMLDLSLMHNQLLEMKHRRQTRRQNCITYFHSNTLMQIPVSGTLTDDLFVLGQLIIERALKWYYIQQRVSYRDKISRAGIIDTNRERDSAAASLDRSSIVGNVALEISLGEFPDIQYIIQHPRPIPITFHPFQQFFTDVIFNITILLQIRQSHDAFSS